MYLVVQHLVWFIVLKYNLGFELGSALVTLCCCYSNWLVNANEEKNLNKIQDLSKKKSLSSITSKDNYGLFEAPSSPQNMS